MIWMKWIYRTKYHSNDHILKRKTILLVKGYVYKQRINFIEKFAPVSRMEMVHIFLAVAAQ